MSRPQTRQLVIDASVAHAAGETQHPVSKACREFLMAVLEICPHMVLSQEIREEWKRHQSHFARKWWRSMTAKKKVDVVRPPATAIDLEAFSPTQRRAVEKDLCLLDAALATNKEIVTLDAALQEALVGTPQGRRLRDSIKWHHPVTDGIAPLEKG